MEEDFRALQNKILFTDKQAQRDLHSLSCWMLLSNLEMECHENLHREENLGHQSHTYSIPQIWCNAPSHWPHLCWAWRDVLIAATLISLKEGEGLYDWLNSFQDDLIQTLKNFPGIILKVHLTFCSLCPKEISLWNSKLFISFINLTTVTLKRPLR